MLGKRLSDVVQGQVKEQSKMSTPSQPDESLLHALAQQSGEEQPDNENDEVDPEELPIRPEIGSSGPQDLLKLEIDVREDPFPIVELVRKIEKGTLNLAPDFQRLEVWDVKKKSRFIESILLNYPLPPLYLNQQDSGVYLVVDGLQRTSSFFQFMKDKYALQGLETLKWLNTKKFSDLEPIIQARIEDRKLNCYILKPSVPLGVVYDIFNRINTGGMALNRQEIRQALHQGPAIALLKNLVAQEPFSEWLGKRLNPKRMIDQEAVLRCIAFARIDGLKFYKGNPDKFLNDTLKQLNVDSKEVAAERREIAEQFPQIMQIAKELLGEDAFRLPIKMRGRLNMPVMESIYRALSLHPKSFWLKHQSQLPERHRALLANEKYREAVRIGTNNTVHIRFPMASQFLEGRY